MPARFRLALERTGGAKTWPSRYAAAYSLRGAVVPFLRDEAGLDGVHGHRYSIHMHTPADVSAATVNADFCLLSDRLVPRAHEALRRMCGTAQPLTIGDVAARVADVGVADVLPAAQLAAAEVPPTGLIDVTFGSITTFAAGNRRARAVPDPSLIIKSWSSAWNGMDGCPHPCPPEVVEALGQHLEPIDGTLIWDTARFRHDPNPGAPTVHAPYTVFGFSGKLTLRLHRAASPEAAPWLSRLARLAAFAGTGYHPQIGLGATRALPRARSAGPPGSLKPPSSADAL